MSEVKEYPVIWLQGAGCTGCSVSVLNAINPSIKNLLIDELFPGKHINLRFHPTIMAGAGKAAIEALEDTSQQKKDGYILVVEGAIPTAKSGIHDIVGNVSISSRVKELAGSAVAVIALGTCAAFGGIAGAYPNLGQCRGVGDILDAMGINISLVNIPGCPPHPDWFVSTVASILLSGLPKPLDEYRRPRAFYGQLVHENCPRRAYYDEKKFAKNLGDSGCLYELGCKGPVTYSDCPLRLWNGGVNWCIANGSPCLGCTEPGFPDEVSPFYEKS